MYELVQLLRFFNRKGMRNFDPEHHEPLLFCVAGIPGPFGMAVLKKKMLMILSKPLLMTAINVISSLYEILSRTFGLQKDKFYHKVTKPLFRSEDILDIVPLPAVVRHTYVMNELWSAQSLFYRYRWRRRQIRCVFLTR